MQRAVRSAARRQRSRNPFLIPRSLHLSVTDPLVGLPLPDSPAELEPVTFPLGWLLTNASGPIQYRAICDVARLDVPQASVAPLRYSSPTGIALSVTQSIGGSWNDSMLTAPNGKAGGIKGVGTVHAVRRLLEYGWDMNTQEVL
jgi:hypothetical protein